MKGYLLERDNSLVATSLRNITALPQEPINHLSLLRERRVGPKLPSPTSNGIVIGRVLYSSCPGSHCCYESMGAIVMSCPEASISKHSFLSSSSHILSSYSFMTFPEPWDGGRYVIYSSMTFPEPGDGGGCMT